MRNKVIVGMMCNQYNWDFRDVEVEFLLSVGDEYQFKVSHCREGWESIKLVKVSVTDYNEE